MRLTACLIVRDEESRLPRALASLAFCDEIVVVDSESTDRTVEIARAAGARVVVQPWLGFGPQRNVAIDHATGDWIIEVDADEWLSDELQRDLRAFLDAPPPVDVAMAAMPRRDRFLGRDLGGSSKYPDYRQRVFRRDAYRHDERRLVHEGLMPTGRVRALRGDLHHDLAGTVREALGDSWKYARLESAHVAPLGSPAAYAKAILVRPAAKFAYRLIVDGGWRDGWQGVTRILVDCGADAVIWARRAAGRVPERAPGAPAHFGRLEPRVGPVRIVAVAYGAPETQRARAWLRDAAAAGADVGLISDQPGGDDPLLQQERVARRGPLLLARAMDAVTQLRPVDRVVCAPSARRAARLLPPPLRGPTQGTLDEDPAAAVHATHAATRSDGRRPVRHPGG